MGVLISLSTVGQGRYVVAAGADSLNNTEGPWFPGGAGQLASYLSLNLRYPVMALDSAVEGEVIVGFDVMDDGSVANVDVEKGLGFGCDEEAKRVIAALPKWQPAQRGGKPVKVHYVLPVIFEMKSEPQAIPPE
ncbi:MAG: energy transducer TonB [Edaphocola sp.]